MSEPKDMADTFLHAIDMTLRSPMLSPGEQLELLGNIRDGVGDRMLQIEEAMRAENWGSTPGRDAAAGAAKPTP